MDYSLPGSSIHGIFQAGVLEWGAIAFSRPQDWKGQFSFQSQTKAMPKNVQTNTIALISNTSKVMLKFLQAWLQQYMNCGLADFQDRFRKGRGTRDQVANISGL